MHQHQILLDSCLIFIWKTWALIFISYLLSPVYNSRATLRKIIVFGSQVAAQDTDSINAFNT